MKKLSTNNICMDKALKITSNNLVGPALWRYDLDRYASSLSRESRPTVAFISPEFSMLLNCIETPIKNFSFNRSKCLCCHKPHKFDELRILTNDNVTYAIDCNGIVCEIRELELEEAENRLAFSTTELWGLPDEKPYKQILLSLKFAEQLDEFLTAKNKIQIVDSLWFDLSQREQDIQIEKTIRISGEYGDYAALGLFCGRFVLLTTKEQESIEG